MVSGCQCHYELWLAVITRFFKFLCYVSVQEFIKDTYLICRASFNLLHNLHASVNAFEMLHFQHLIQVFPGRVHTGDEAGRVAAPLHGAGYGCLEAVVAVT